MQNWKMNIVNRLSEKTKDNETISLFETAKELGYNDILIGDTPEIIDAFLEINSNYKVIKEHHKGILESPSTPYLFPSIKFIPLGYEELVRRNNLAKLRKNKGHSQSKLSKLSGVNIRLIQKYESGERDFRKAQVLTAMKLADALQVTIDELLRQ
jgi:DNA-binding XRE family transcriptional regulator